MPKILGLVNYFPNIEQINSNELMSRFGKKIDPRLVENALGNLILYSQTTPQTAEDFQFEANVIGLAIKVDSKEFYQAASKRIIIPEDFFSIIPNLYQLVSMFINAIKPVSINQIAMKSNNDGLKVLGTYIKPTLINKKGIINLQIDDQKYQVEIGKSMTIPVLGRKADIHFESSGATLFERSTFSAEIAGGIAGVILDASLN